MQPAEAGQLDSLVSVVVPAYRSVGSIPILVDRVHVALKDVPHEIIFVDDGSPPQTWEAIETVARDDAAVRGVRLSRNSGQHAALLAGIRAAAGNTIVTIDDDLQNPPEEIPTLLAALTPDVDLVYGRPREVAQTWWRRTVSGGFRTVFSSVVGIKTSAEATSFRAFRTRLRDGFSRDLGPGVSIDAVLSWSTERFIAVDVRHDERDAGKSNYSFRKLLRFAVDTATGYSAAPLQIALGLGLLTALFGFVVLIWVVLRYFIGDTNAPGFAFLASIISIFAGVQLMTLGIMGEYLARMHFRLMNMPTYTVADEVSAESRVEPDA